MLAIKGLLALLAGLAAAESAAKYSRKPGCGDVNIIFTGLPPAHPLVTAQGFNSTLVEAGLRRDAANILKAGYNLKVVLFGPEQPASVLADQMDGEKWHGTGVGYGVRGSPRPDLTIRLEEITDVYRKKAPRGYILYNYSPVTAEWAVKRKFPLSSNCTDEPGEDLGFEIICDVCK